VATPVVLDSNIYDLLAVDAPTVELIRDQISGGRLQIIVPRTVAEELWLSPFKGIPSFFPTVVRGNTVGRIGLMTCIDSIGAGQTFGAHIGSSRKVNDALIADAADWMAQWLVSQDARLRSRLVKVAMRCQPLNYDEFRSRLGTLR
jgi:hypothetical protein